jgi:predicted transcriptional regulator YdeE
VSIKRHFTNKIRFIYTEWLPKSEYNPSDVFGDFELHDDRSLGKNPEINLYVAFNVV